MMPAATAGGPSETSAAFIDQRGALADAADRRAQHAECEHDQRERRRQPDDPRSKAGRADRERRAGAGERGHEQLLEPPGGAMPWTPSERKSVTSRSPNR